MVSTPASDLDRPVENNEFLGARERFPLHDFVGFHEAELPGLLRSRGALAGADVAEIAPIALRVGNAAFTYRPGGGGVAVDAGEDSAAAVVALSNDAFSDFVNEIHSVSGLAMGGKLSFERGELADLHRWEPALRALYTGRPIWTPSAAAELVDANGERLDLARAFTLDDADEELRAFLEVAGFLHVRGAFGPGEVAELGAELERVRAALEPGKGDCWWSTKTDGTQVVTRINYLDRWSQRLKAQCFEARIQRLGRLIAEDLRVCDDRLDGPMAFVKNSNVAQGLGDLQWHQDDGLGGHPVMCPLMQVGLQLDAANAENGQVWVLAGSHRYTNHPMAWGDEDGKPVVKLVTEPGDVTVHFGDIYHTTPPPTAENAGRRVLYFKFAKPRTFEMIPAGAHYNDVLFKAGAEGRVATRADTWSEDDTQEAMESKIFGEG
jgi:hypothetical protein